MDIMLLKPVPIKTVTIAILHQKFQKVIKTTQNVPKTVDNHQEQLVFNFSHFSLKKG